MTRKRNLREYDIKFINLKLGKHFYNFNIDSLFFGNFEESLVSECQAEVELIMDKQSETLFLLEFKIHGRFQMLCDRCLSEYLLPFNIHHNMVLKVESGFHSANNDDDIILVSPYDFKINIAENIFELISFQLPMKSLCELGGSECDREMIQEVNKHLQIEDGNLQDLKNFIELTKN